MRPGGWAFQYSNAHYPDLDDTAVVVMAMDRARGSSAAPCFDEAIARGREWVVGLQSKDGGWGAFDADNNYHYLNNIPFADHGALLARGSGRSDAKRSADRAARRDRRTGCC